MLESTYLSHAQAYAAGYCGEDCAMCETPCIKQPIEAAYIAGARMVEKEHVMDLGGERMPTLRAVGAKSLYEIQCQASRLWKRATDERRATIAGLVKRYSRQIQWHQIGTLSITWQQYEQRYTREQRYAFYMERLPRFLYAGY